MSTRHLIAALAALALLAPVPSHADDAASDRGERIDRYLEDYAEANHVPGLAVAVVDADGVQHEHLRGEDGDGHAVTPDTPFFVGSVAKTMTATVVMQLEAEGELSLDDRVSDHIDHLPAGDPTIEQLLTHTAGFTGADGNAVADREASGPDAVRRAVEDLEHSGTVGDYEYTSADYLVLGAIVESVTGQPYGAAVQRRLLEPLGLDAISSREQAEDLPPGHRLWWGQAVDHDPELDESGTPYSTIALTLTDLTRYARAQLGLDDTIPASIRAEMQAPHVESSQDHYGLGWSITEVDGKRVVHHTGATPGYFAHVLLVPEDGVAVVLLANAYAESRAPSLAGGAEDVWRITRGEEREVQGGDPMLSALPWVLVGVAGLGLALVALARRRPVRRVLRAVAALGAAVVVLALWLLPTLFGQDHRALRIWVPDAAWSLVAGMVVWGLACVALLLPARRARPASTRADSTTVGVNA